MLQICRLSLKRQKQFLFQNLNFQLNPGELLQITGANGAGKTSLLRILAGFLKPTTGEIHYPEQAVSAIAYLGHTNPIKPSLTVYENLASHCALMGKKLHKIDAVVTQLELNALIQKLAYQLSAGQQRRLALAKIALTEKPIWLLDEPFTALDKSSMQQFMLLLAQHLHNKGIAIIATHQTLNLNVPLATQLSL
jgi:heme exporter protein A